MQNQRGFTLIELLVVVAIIVLLLAVLLPSLSTAREQARSSVCGSQLHQIGLAGVMYAQIHRGWLAGSPNTSGNGARPGFAAGDYTATVNPDHYPAMQVFDWAAPLLPLISARPPKELRNRYAAAVSGPVQCPSNRRRTGPVTGSPLEYLLPSDILAPGYATSRHLMYVGSAVRNGAIRGTLWWSDDAIPSAYRPHSEQFRQPAFKVFLADAHIVSQTRGEISNANWGFTSQGAWRAYQEFPETYRGDYLKEQMWRHRGAINLAAMDGHAERQAEGDSGSEGGYGTGARRARWWFPTGTRTERLPSFARTKEASILVP